MRQKTLFNKWFSDVILTTEMQEQKVDNLFSADYSFNINEENSLDFNSDDDEKEIELEKEIAEMMQEVMEAEKKEKEENDDEINSKKFEDLLLEEQKADKDKNDHKEGNVNESENEVNNQESI
tara:strand:+ start:474 stop:842 length:369 start_codon:yes stop_codon:yes gene_type:complete